MISEDPTTKGFCESCELPNFSDGKLFAFFQVRSVLEEIRVLYEANEKEIWAEQPSKSAIVLRHAALERDKRCLLAYLYHRTEKIRDMRWEFGVILPQDIKANLSGPELAFFTKYNRDLATYMGSVGGGAGVDLLTDQHPPKSLYIEVRCVQDYGEFEAEDGSVVMLSKNTQHFLPRAQCEQLIRQGILEHVRS